MNEEDFIKNYNFTRKDASVFLQVSIRTIDRYIKSKKLSTRMINGRILLNEIELEEFKREKNIGGGGYTPKNKKIIKIGERKDTVDTVDTGVDRRVDKVDKVDKVDIPEIGAEKNKEKHDDINIISSFERGQNKQEDLFAESYKEIKQDLREKQERLEIANYRVGQLEAQLKNSIPLLEYHNQNLERRKKQEETKKQLKDSFNIIEKLQQKLNYQKYSKTIFLIILFIILALQPIWLFFVLNES